MIFFSPDIFMDPKHSLQPPGVPQIPAVDSMCSTQIEYTDITFFKLKKRIFLLTSSTDVTK